MTSSELTIASLSCAESVPVTARNVVFLAPSFGPYGVPVFQALHQRVGEGFTVVALSYQRLEIARAALTMGTFPRRIVGGRTVSLSSSHNHGRKSPICLNCAPSLPFLLKSLNPEVVISMNFNLWTLTSLFMGYPTVLFWEGTHHTERSVQPWRTRLRRWIGKRIRACVVSGMFASHYLTETIGVPEDQIIEGGLCPMPAPEHVRCEPRLVRPGEPLKFLFVGQMIGRKGVLHLLHATKLLDQRLEKCGGFELLLLGDGPERSDYERLSQELGIQDCVRFLGFVPPDQVWSYYEQAHVFVLPTLHDTWALVVPEAMSTALPVLVSKHAGAAADFIREGENGWSFDPEDHEGLACHLEKYVRNPHLVAPHGKRSLELVSPYTPQRAANAFLWAVAKAQEQIRNKSYQR